MKFEKYLKNTGIYGIVFAASNGDKYLGCGKDGHILARIPAGFAPIGAAEVYPMETWIDHILIKSVDDLSNADLAAARLEKDGRAKDIQRVFRDVIVEGEKFGERECVIDNAAFGLIERSDMLKIFDPQVDLDVDEDDLEPIDEEPLTPENSELIKPALVLLDRAERVVGIIIDSRWENV